MCTMVVGTVLVVSVTPVSNEKKAAGDEGDIDNGVSPINLPFGDGLFHPHGDFRDGLVLGLPH